MTALKVGPKHVSPPLIYPSKTRNKKRGGLFDTLQAKPAKSEAAIYTPSRDREKELWLARRVYIVALPTVFKPSPDEKTSEALNNVCNRNVSYVRARHQHQHQHQWKTAQHKVPLSLFRKKEEKWGTIKPPIAPCTCLRDGQNKKRQIPTTPAGRRRRGAAYNAPLDSTPLRVQYCPTRLSRRNPRPECFNYRSPQTLRLDFKSSPPSM